MYKRGNMSGSHGYKADMNPIPSSHSNPSGTVSQESPRMDAGTPDHPTHSRWICRNFWHRV